MEKIIKYGFQPITNTRIRGQNETKGKKLYESGHVFDVIEKKSVNGTVTITAKVVAETKVDKLYDVNIILDDERNTIKAWCACKGGSTGECKHFGAVVSHINSPDSADSKTNRSQEWGKPSRRQLLEYDKGMRMSKLFAPYSHKEVKVEPLKLESLEFPKDLSGSPLCTMINIDKRKESEIIAAESLVALVKMTEQRDLKIKVHKVIEEVVQLQLMNAVYSEEHLLASTVYQFYAKEVYCNKEKVSSICSDTILQFKTNEWYKQRIFRITASNGHKLKGDRFDIDKAITELLSPSKVETQAMAYGKKMESTALKEYKKLIDPKYELIQVGLVVNIVQPWLCCSPDAILIYGPNIWQKRLIEIKCPYSCKKLPVYDAETGKSNVQYIRADENGLHLSKTHSIYTQVQLQMYVTNIAFCDLFVYSPLGCVLITIARDELFLSKVVHKLEKFYFEHYIGRVFMKFNQST